MLYNCMIIALSIFSFNRLPYKTEFVKKNYHIYQNPHIPLYINKIKADRLDSRTSNLSAYLSAYLPANANGPTYYPSPYYVSCTTSDNCFRR